MGTRALDGSAPTAGDIAAMQAMLGDALDAGAVGLSLGRISGHQIEGGGYTPDFGAPDEEVLALVAIVATRPGKIVQFATDFGLRRADAATAAELDLLGRVAAIGAPITMPLHQWPEIDGGWRRIAAHVDGLNAAGGDVRLEVSARAIGMLMGLELSVHPFLRHPSYRAIADLPFADRLARMREPTFRAALLGETSDATGGDESVGRLLARMEQDAHRIFVCVGAPDYEPDPATSVRAMADASGLPVMEVYYDALLAGDGRTLLYFPFFNFAGNNLDEQRAMLALPRALFSFGDAGAHSSQICDSAYSSFALAFWGRDRRDGLPLERLVH
jgi:N-acyl-D-aspartate/D-glutamate deacylase